MGLFFANCDPKIMPSVSVKDVNQQAFTKAFAEFLKKSGKVKQPEWADLVKTAKFKELPLMMMIGISQEYQLLPATSICVLQLVLEPSPRSSELACAVVPAPLTSVLPAALLPAKLSRHWNS